MITAKKVILSLVLSVFSLAVLAGPKYSMSVFQRPFTMPQNSFESSLKFSNSNMMILEADYGITDQFQLGLAWEGFDTAGKLPNQKISLNAAHFLFSTPYASSMLVLNMPFYFDRMVLQQINLSLSTYVPLVRGHLNLILLEDLAKFSWLTETYADFKISTRFSWQATQALCLNLITSPVTLSTSGEHTYILQATPIHFKALYAVTPMVDIVGVMGFDNIQNASGFSALLGIALRGGDIEG
jgi:hypothetical protein